MVIPDGMIDLIGCISLSSQKIVSIRIVSIRERNLIMGSFDDIQKNNRADSAESANQVLYRPGEEPQEVRQQLEELFEKLDFAYPDKVISGLYTDHKKMGRTGYGAVSQAWLS